jgi:hypothetical protein
LNLYNVDFGCERMSFGPSLRVGTLGGGLGVAGGLIGMAPVLLRRKPAEPAPPPEAALAQQAAD